MTNVSNPMPAQHSAVQSAIAGLFSAAILVAAGVMAFTAFVNV